MFHSGSNLEAIPILCLSRMLDIACLRSSVPFPLEVSRQNQHCKVQSWKEAGKGCTSHQRELVFWQKYACPQIVETSEILESLTFPLALVSPGCYEPLLPDIQG